MPGRGLAKFCQRDVAALVSLQGREGAGGVGMHAESSVCAYLITLDTGPRRPLHLELNDASLENDPGAQVRARLGTKRILGVWIIHVRCWQETAREEFEVTLQLPGLNLNPGTLNPKL